MTLATIPLCIPPVYLAMDAKGFTALLFVVAVGMGIGKASVFKYIPNYYPRDVGAVGGLVGLLGGLGGFLLPKAFGLLGRTTGFPQAAFLAILAISAGSLLWLHFAVRAISMTQRRANLEKALQVAG